MPRLIVVCLLASSDAVWAVELSGVWPTCQEPWQVEKAAVAADRGDWVAVRTLKCDLLEDPRTLVRVIRCAADVTPRDMEQFSHPVPSDDSLPNHVCEVEAFDDDGSTGIYYTFYLNVKKSTYLPSSGARVTDWLRGTWPTCWEPWEVEKAHAAVRRDDWVAWRTMKCGLHGDYGTPVRVIRCAADVTPAQMKRFSLPVPRDDSLPDRICEVEAFEDDGSSGIYYTYYFNINYFNVEKSP